MSSEFHVDRLYSLDGVNGPLVPTPDDIDSSERAANTEFVKRNGGATGGSTDKVFFLNDQVVTTDFTIPVGKNAITAGDVTIASGITVTISSGSKWSIV